MNFETVYVWFNALEGLLWIGIAGMLVWYASKNKHTRYVITLWCASAFFFLFGISDFVEIYTHGFVGHHTWLFFWKAACVFGFVLCFVWYLQIRRGVQNTLLSDVFAYVTTKRNITALSIFAVFYVAFGTYLTVFQESFVYQPRSQDFDSCLGFRDAQKITHRGTRMYVHQGERGMVVLYHGNGGSACDRDFFAELFVQAGYGYIVTEYAGYSNDPRPTTHALVKKDVANVVSYISQQSFGYVVVVGESVGTGAASYHVSLKTPDNILLISPFTSLADVARRKFWFYPTFLLVDNAFDSQALLAHYTGPITIMHGDQDMIISQKSGLKLYENLISQQKKFVSIEGRGHNDLFEVPESFEVLQSFLEREASKRVGELPSEYENE